jgi:hypothetical protein
MSRRPDKPAARVTSRGTSRKPAVDFFRGLGLWGLFIDHCEPNFWSYFTPGHMGFSDFSEVFIFLSGYINAGVYRRALEAGGVPRALHKLGARVVRLYVAHIASMAAGMAVIAAFASRGLRLNDPALYLWMDAPANYTARALALLYAPGWFGLLPLYIVLAPATLLAVIAMRRRPLLTLAISCSIWCAAQTHTFDLRGLTGAGSWTFNPLAWQFLFVIGASTEMYWERVRRAVDSRMVVRCAAAVVLISFALRAVTRFRSVQRSLTPAFLSLMAHDAGKVSVSPLRLVHFFSLAILVVAIPWNARRIFESALARTAIGTGRDSLLIFCVTLVLTPVGNLLLQHYRGGLAAQFAVSALGLGIMSGIAFARGKVPNAPFGHTPELQPEQSRK